MSILCARSTGPVDELRSSRSRPEPLGPERLEAEGFAEGFVPWWLPELLQNDTSPPTPREGGKLIFDRRYGQVEQNYKVAMGRSGEVSGIPAR